MYLKFNRDEDKLIVTLNGELDHHSAEEVRVKIDDRLDRDNVRKLILNFSGVTFMNSSGIGVVIGRYKKLITKDGKVVIAEPKGSVKRVFELSGLFKIVKAYDSIEEAINCH